jgi:hypothetical protein
MQPFAYFYANNPKVTIISEGPITTRITGYTPIPGGNTAVIRPLRARVALVKGIFLSYQVVSDPILGGVNVGFKNIVSLTEQNTFLSGVNETCSVGLNLTFNNLELGPYTLCMVYETERYTGATLETNIPRLSITCEALF